VKALIIKSPWIDLILQGKKKWEIRGSNTKTRGRIALIKSGTGTILGTVDLVDSKKITMSEYLQNKHNHCIEETIEIPYINIHAWIFQNPVIFENPIPYKHPQGAVIWVNLEDHSLF
jgi:hypothetical protein